MSKAIILYYSNSGSTQKAAELIKDKTGAKLVKFTFNPAYPNEFDKLKDIVEKQEKGNIIPEITNDLNLKDYETIYLGFPTWFEQPPMFIKGFLANHELTNQTIIPFTTSMSSSADIHDKYLKEWSNNTVNLKPTISGNDLNSLEKQL